MADETPLTKTVSMAAYRSAVKRRAQTIADKTAEAQKAQSERDAALKDADELRKQIAELGKKIGEADALKDELRALKYRKVADDVLREAGIDPSATEAFYKLTEIKFDGEEPDPAKIKAFVEAERVKPGVSNLFAGHTEQTDEIPAPGRGQGGHAANGNRPFQATREQLRDPAWCHAHQAQLEKASNDVADLPLSKVAERFVIP